jgi:hypothetical protein
LDSGAPLISIFLTDVLEKEKSGSSLTMMPEKYGIADCSEEDDSLAEVFHTLYIKQQPSQEYSCACQKDSNI